MQCPECGCLDSVRCFRTNSSTEEPQVHRLRRCTKCGCRFSTEEKVKGPVRKKISEEEVDQLRKSIADKRKKAEKLGI